MADKKTDEAPAVAPEEVVRVEAAPTIPLRPATPAEQVAFNEARRRLARAGLPPPDPPAGILFDMNLPD
jgi:hypothetical protein